VRAGCIDFPRYNGAGFADDRVLSRPFLLRSLRPVSVLALLPACGRDSPVAPSSSPPMISGYIYLQMTRGSGEPPIANVLITVRHAGGAETMTSSDGRGFYSVRTATGTVVVTATKNGYETGEFRFDVTDSTVLNFSLMLTPA
jgi:hypothetical protein